MSDNDKNNGFECGTIASVVRTAREHSAELESELATARNEIARLRELVEDAYNEGVNDTFDFGVTDGNRGWLDSDAKAALDGEGKHEL